MRQRGWGKWRKWYELTEDINVDNFNLVIFKSNHEKGYNKLLIKAYAIIIRLRI